MRKTQLGSTALGSLIFGLIAGISSWADDGNPAYTDVKKAPADYGYQGEYLGAHTETPEYKLGVQIIALGEGKFDLIGYDGGLPGQGWSRGDETVRLKGTLADGKIKFASKDDDRSAVLEDGAITAYDGEGNKMAEFKKTERKSPTLGAKPTENAVVLFDGSTAERFENGKLIEGGLLGATNCFSKEKLGDHHLHIEFRTPFMPKSRGQARGNSGVYMQSRYELQVLDSFGLDGKNNECGGIYSISEPIVNMCLPPLSWQTYDIDFTAARYDDQGNKTKNARATIRHNGVVIHRDLELPHGTPGRLPEGAGPESLFLQNHGNPVAFRNIWVEKK